MKLDQALAGSVKGDLIGRVGELDYLLAKPGAAVGLDDITVEELACLRVIDDERAKYTKKETERIQREQQGRAAQIRASRQKRLSDL